MRLYQSICFKTIYEISNEQLLSKCILCKAFDGEKVSKKMLKKVNQGLTSAKYRRELERYC